MYRRNRKSRAQGLLEKSKLLSTVNILDAFSRPKKVTEEEISISKEKKTYLVCKGKVGGYNFICTDCGAFYCKKCAEVLEDMENTCWVCNTPINALKPVKLPEKEEEKPFPIEEELKKRTKN